MQPDGVAGTWIGKNRLKIRAKQVIEFVHQFKQRYAPACGEIHHFSGGVRVLTFSLGFGPKIAKVVIRSTA